MKKIILLFILIFSINIMAQESKEIFNNIDSLVNEIIDSTDTLLSFTFNTKWRSQYNIDEMKGKPYPDFSKVTMIFNRSDNKGLIFDETETVTSLYYLTNFEFIKKDNNTIIYGKMISNVGNKYIFIFDDYNNSFITTGFFNAVVIRRLYNLKITTDNKPIK